jgi:hypothetical protein
VKHLNHFFAVLFLVGFIFTSCKTTTFDSYPLPETAPLAVDEAHAQVIVTRLDNDGGYIGIFIDGHYAGKLGNGQTGYYKLMTGGIHRITAVYDIYDVRVEHGYIGSFWATKEEKVNWGVMTDPIEFVDYGSFYVKYIGYEYRSGYDNYYWEYLVELTPGDR